MRVVKASAVQLSPVLYSREGTVEKVVQKIHELGQQGVQFATFPETVVPYYPYFSIVQSGYQILAGGEFVKLLEQSVTVPSPATGRACAVAGVSPASCMAAAMSATVRSSPRSASQATTSAPRR